MNINERQIIIIKTLKDIKAQDIKVYDTSNLTNLFDRITIASGNSKRQIKALAVSICKNIKNINFNILNIEGKKSSEWLLLDLGDIIVHIMKPDIRNIYNLEEIWGEKEIKFN
ncbi:ribosome silencing factor [Candidatus Profftella armatura (Diaphorina cf. continua)]|uniref:Ribosomal silencing factor RsfS n=1 Tax=Candidatus Profftella armatura (Diaphorina cf. continua) TaxID=2661583 RepID=A0A7R7AAY2_9PROT|nr:ribosome silencing factor [Candidatus Profftella armatura (Diaphorina cf. continua)]BCG49430.1 ribosome silencing factor [Candidatus Profftella armatura (Diaphorina cf. continua)]